MSDPIDPFFDPTQEEMDLMSVELQDSLWDEFLKLPAAQRVARLEAALQLARGQLERIRANLRKGVFPVEHLERVQQEIEHLKELRNRCRRFLAEAKEDLCRLN